MNKTILVNIRIDELTGFRLMQMNCPVCKTCWAYVDGPLAGRCIYAGPFKGYVDVK